MNFLIEKYLSNFVEIDTSQTKASIFSGTINLKNLKIKREIFKSINLSNFEVVNGYIGNLLIKLKMPRFYKYPINLEVDKVFLHVKQINIDKKKKEEEIKAMEDYKNKTLKDEEEFRQNWENVDKEESNIFQQIMNDLQIEIKEVIIHVDDTISYKSVPFTLGIILNKLVIKTPKNDYGVEEKITENILNQNIKYKIIHIDNFSIYLDCFDDINEFNSQTLSKISKKIYEENSNNNSIKDYYDYCMKEFNLFLSKKNFHQYILYKMQLIINIKTNDNYLKMNEPHHSISINLPRLHLRFSLKQIKTIFKVKAYNNLYYLYQNGISKAYYKKISLEQKKDYIKKYQEYYEDKYFNKRNENIEFPQELIEIEKNLSLEELREMRNIAYNTLSNSMEYYKKKKGLEEEENKWLGKNTERIAELKEELKKIEKKELEISKKKENINKHKKKSVKMNNEEDIEKALSNLNFNLKINFTVGDTKFIVFEIAKKNNLKDRYWSYDDILIKFLFSNFAITGDFSTNVIKLEISLDDTIVSHGKSKNPNYQNLLFGEASILQGKVLKIIFEKNPTFQYSDYKLEMIFEKTMHILYDNHIFNYIINKIMSILNTTINFNEINMYAKDEFVNEYIHKGYADSFFKNFQHFNIQLNINLLSPIILLPLDPFVPDNNKCILLRLGRLQIGSKLPPRQEKGIKYKEIQDEKLLYDKYLVNLIGTNLSTITDCTAVNKCEDYRSFETKIIRDFDMEVICKKLIEIKNPYFDDLVCELKISKVEMKIDEFQILFLIDYLGNFMKDDKIIFKENEIDKLLAIDEENSDEENLIERWIQENENDSKTSDNVSDFKLSDKESKSSELKSVISIENNNEKEKGENPKEDNFNNEKDDEKKKNKVNKDTLSIKTIITERIENEKVDAHQRIAEIRKNKKQLKIQLDITEMSLSIKKIHPDLKIENFLLLQQQDFKIECFMMNNGDILTLLKMNNISLYDNDLDENKYLYVEEPFQCLINSSKNLNDKNVGFINMTALYRKFGEAKEIETIFDMNNLNIIISFDSLLRIYQFMMYYLDKYNEKMYDISHLDNKKGNMKKFNDESLSKNFSKRESSRKNFNLLTKSTFRKESTRKNRISILKRTNFIKSSVFKTDIKKEVYDTKMTMVYNMNNTIFKIPLDPKNFVTPIIFFSFNLIYNQFTRNQYTNYLKLPQNLLIETVYKTQDSKTNLLISKVYLDIIFNNQELSNFVYENEKLISNFRMSYLSSSFLSLKTDQIITTSDMNIEPLFCKFGVRQLIKLLEFYQKVTSFWNDFCNIKYIPFMKPEYIVDGKPIRKPKKKRKFRECVLRIMIAIEIRKGTKNYLDRIRNQYKKNIKKKKNDNISELNSHSEMSIIFRKIIVTFYDNMSAERRLLLNLNIYHIFTKLIWNSKVKDKQNASNMIYEMVTGDYLPRDKYNLDTLASYTNINCGAEINYFNMNLNEFEPLMEKIQVEYYMMQSCPFSKKKHFLNINDMINFNISSNAIKVVNLFLLRYYDKENEKKEKNKLIRSEKIKKTKIRESTIKLSNSKIDKNKEVYLVIVNFLEFSLNINFELNFGKKHHLAPRGTLTFYKQDIFSEKNKANSTKFNAVIENQSTIKGIDFGKNNTRQYKIRITKKNKESDLYISVKVNTSGLIRQVHFCPSISIYNDTNFEEIELFIKNRRIKYNSIIIKQNNKAFVPLTWFFCEEPMSSIYMKIKENIEPIKLYDHISQAIIEPLDPEEKEERKDKKKKLEKSTKKNKNKYWNQNEINSLLNEYDNRKDNKIVYFVEDDQKFFFSIDYYFVQSKEIQNILAEREKELKLMNFEDTMTTMDELSNDYSYDYLIYIRPFATFFNQLPFELTFTHGNSNEKILKTFNSSFLYSDLREEKEQIRITFNYNGDKFRSPYFDITVQNSVELVDCDNQTAENLFCCILKSQKRIDFNKNFNYDVNLIEFSTSSYTYIFYFKYLIMNKLPESLWAKPSRKKKSKKEKIKECELKSGAMTIMSQNHSSETKYVIREEGSKWSEPFDLKTINKNGTIEIDTEIETDERKRISTKDISYILSWGKNYENSRLLIFQEQFIIHNKLNFDIYYKQEKDKENINHFLKKESLESINRVKEKKIFRLGLFDSTCGQFNYSSPFDIGILKTVDLLIKINEQEKNNYDKHFVYTNDEKNYYVLIRIESSIFDDGLIYLTITNPYFPSLKIENETEFPVKIYEEKNEEKPLIICSKLQNGFPFVWKNNSKEKIELFFEIEGYKQSFSFSKYEKEIIDIEYEEDSYDSRSRSTSNVGGGVSNDSSSRKVKKKIMYTVHSKNSSLTRCLTLSEKVGNKNNINEKIDGCLFVRNKSKVISTSFKVKLKGVGFSIINEALVELFYISFYMINIKYLSNKITSHLNGINENTENFEFHLNNFQIDYCLHDSIKYIIAPENQFIPSYSEFLKDDLMTDKEKKPKSNKEITPFISFLVTKQFIQYIKTMEESTIYRQIDFIIQKFICKIDQYTLTNLLNIINEFMELLDYSKKLEEKSNDQDTKLLNEKISERIANFKKNKNNSKVLINYLFLSSIKFYLTIRLNLNEISAHGITSLLAHILGSLGNTLARFTDVPLYFTEKGFVNIYISLSEIFYKIYEEYKSQGTAQILKLIGSSDILGNPVKLLEGIGTGFYELVNEPRKQFVNGPVQFGKGIVKGLGKLLSGIIGGAFGVVESISGTLYSTMRSLTWRKHENNVEEDEGPSNIATGFVQGLYGGFKELKNGIFGVVLHPKDGLAKSGAKGFFKGIGKGLIGLAVSPFAATFRFLHSLAIGTKNTVYFILGNSKRRIKRFRYPRVLSGGEEPMRAYEYVKAFAKSEILKIFKMEKNIKYAEFFVCRNKGFNKERSLFVKLNKTVFIIYKSKIIFEAAIKSLKNCEIHYRRGYFIVKFCLKRGGSKGFKVHSYYAAFVCKLFDLFQNLKKKEEEQNKKILNNNSILQLDELEEKETIININDKNNNIINKISLGKSENINLNKDESIIITDLNKEVELKSDIENNKKENKGIVINNIFINVDKNTNLKNILKKNINNENNKISHLNNTIVNNESVFSSIKEDDTNKNSNNENKISMNESHSEIRYNSNENFIHQLIFSESSKSSDE